ncbi:hypothetical protein Clow_01153 [Corynebacterium lowii]|uniref:Uncharacterized protein n=2 Tax=Corynebacterium lowii TaxID=1544413 RepID=A0A0Q0U4Q5_9CORY|nr:hypothetical protein Clow_01153 [Corynebacterium lowii]
MGAAMFFLQWEKLLWAFIFFAVVIALTVFSLRRAPFSRSDNWDQRDIYAHGGWSFTGFMFLVLVSRHFIPQNLTSAAIIGIIVAVASTFLMRDGYRVQASVGRRRAKELLQEEVELSQEQIDAARMHSEVLGVLYTLGAVEGVRVRTRLVTYAMGTSLRKLRPEIQKLREEGLITTSAVDAGDDEERVFLALTPKGLHAYDQASRMMAVGA